MRRSKRGLYFWTRQAHLWLGLAIGLYFVALGLTGSVLVFADPLDRWLNPALREVPVASDAGSAAFSEVLAAVAEVENEQPIMRVYAPQAEGQTWSFWMGSLRDMNQIREVFINPYDATVVGERRLLFCLVGFSKYVHFFLMLGMMGFLLNGVLGVITLMLLLSGLVLWWPKTIKQLKSRLRVRWGAAYRRVNLDLHNAVGVWSLPLLALITFTGSAFVFHHQVEAVVVAILGPESEPQQLDADPLQTAEPVTVDKMLHAIAQAVPDGQLVRLTGVQGDRPMRAIMNEPGDDAWHTYTMLEVDKTSGAVSSIHRPSTKSDYALRAFMPLHAGTFGGVWTKLLYAILGLLPALLFITGLTIWLRPKFKRPPDLRSP